MNRTLRVAAQLCCAFGLALAAMSSSMAQVDDWPSRPITLIVPYPPGGANDTVGRMVGHLLSEHLGKSVVVENRGGAGGMIGLQALKKAAPDGYTFGIVPTGPLDVNPALYATVPYRPNDFVPVAPIVTIPLFLAVNPKTGIKSVDELVHYAKGRPEGLTFSSAGIGNSTHLAGEMLAVEAGFAAIHVPFRGAGPAALAVISGEVDFTFGSGPSVLAHAANGSLIVLGTAQDKRLDFKPEITTIKEAGLPEFQVVPWAGMIAPAGVPPEIINRMNAAIQSALKDEVIIQKLHAQGMVPDAGSPEELTRRIEDGRMKYTKLIKTANIKAE